MKNIWNSDFVYRKSVRVRYDRKNRIWVPVDNETTSQKREVSIGTERSIPHDKRAFLSRKEFIDHAKYHNKNYGQCFYVVRKDTDEYYIPVNITDSGIFINIFKNTTYITPITLVSYGELKRHYTWLDGSPCVYEGDIKQMTEESANPISESNMKNS